MAWEDSVTSHPRPVVPPMEESNYMQSSSLAVQECVVAFLC